MNETKTETTVETKTDENETKFDYGTRLSQYILSFSDLILDQDKNTYLWTTIDNESKLIPLHSSECNAFLTKTGAIVFKKIPSKHTIDNVINYFWALASQQEETELYERIRFTNNEEDNILINLNDGFSRHVSIDKKGYNITQSNEPLFKINPEAKPLPWPFEGKGNFVKELLGKFDLGNEKVAEENLMLLEVWMHAGFIPNIALPVLSIFGLEGSGKTRLAIWLHEVIDPNEGKTFSLHRADDLLYTCSHSRIIVLDNLREIKKGLSDELCRIVLGDTKFKRQLYTNNDIYKFKLKNILMTTSINNIIVTPDLLDRSLLVRCGRLEGKFVSEEELDEYFSEIRPYLFHEIIQNLSKSLTIKPQIQLETSPRMKSFGVWGEAIAQAIGYEKGYFIKTYLKKIDSQKKEAVQENLLGSLLIEFMENKPTWEGTINDLLSAIQLIAKNEDERKQIPKTAGQLSIAMDEIKVVLKCANIKYDSNLKRTGNRKYVKLTQELDENIIKDSCSDLIDNEDAVMACLAT
jgi:hypothetical protein